MVFFDLLIIRCFGIKVIICDGINILFEIDLIDNLNFVIYRILELFFVFKLIFVSFDKVFKFNIVLVVLWLLVNIILSLWDLVK